MQKLEGSRCGRKICSALEHIADFVSNVLQSGGLFICNDGNASGVWVGYLRAFAPLPPRRIPRGATCRAHKQVRLLCATHSIVR